MALGHEKLDVYQLAVSYVVWVNGINSRLKGTLRTTKDQWARASQSIALNIAEGNGKATASDRRRFFEIARGSVFECAAIQDILERLEILTRDENTDQKRQLDRIAAMLSRLGGRAYPVTK